MTAKEQLGILIALFAVASMVMWIANLNFRIFIWIDMWGPEIGWGIRIAIAAIGIYIYRTGDEIA